MDTVQLIEKWRAVISGDTKSWVLFAHGTCVILVQPADDLVVQATELLREYGPVHVGSPAADFGTITLEPGPGWVVYGHHDDVLTYVDPGEVDGDANDFAVGLFGRSKRDRDGHELHVIHVEDKRNAIDG